MFMCASTAISVPLRSYLPWMALRGAVTSGAVPAAVGHRLCRTRSRTQAEPVVVAAGGSLSPPPQKQRFGSLQERQREETPPLLTGTVLLSPEREHWWQRWRCASSSAVSSSSSETWQARDVPAKKACWWHLGNAGEEAVALLPPAPCTPNSLVPCSGQQQGHGRRAAGWQRPGEDTWRIQHQIKGTSAGDVRQKAFNASPWSRQIYSRDSFPFPITKKLRQLDIQETLFNTFLFI